MQWFYDLKISGKLILGFGVISFFQWFWVLSRCMLTKEQSSTVVKVSNSVTYSERDKRL